MIHAIALAIALNPGQQRSVRLLPSSFPVSARSAHGLFAVRVDEVTHTVVLTARGQTGNDILALHPEQRDFALPIRIALNAGTIPAHVTLRVTGDPLSATWLAQQVHDILARVLLVASGATANIGMAHAVVRPPPLGKNATLAFPVRIGGDAHRFSVQGTTLVHIRHVDAPSFTPPLLVYDDDPEQLQASGRLSDQTVRSGSPVRLYSYHQNGRTPRRFVVALTSTSSRPVRVALIAAPAGPSADVMSVGHATTRDFLVQQPANEGVIVTVAPDTPYVVLDDTLGARDAVAETLDVRVLSSSSVVSLTTMALPIAMNPIEGLQLAALPGDGKARRGVFSIEPFDTSRRSYTVGGADATVEYGRRNRPPPPMKPGENGRDLGDYGVLRTIVFVLHNPSAQPREVYLYEKPLGGIVRSSFLVDGTLVQLGCVRVPKEYLITPFELAPKMTYRVVVKTMTDGGSNYPLLVGLGTTVPVVHAPPVRAKDGCFPK